MSLLNQPFENFIGMGNAFYFFITVPIILIFAWHGSIAIGRKNKSILLKVIFILGYILGLFGLLFLGNYLFLILFFGLNL